MASSVNYDENIIVCPDPKIIAQADVYLNNDGLITHSAIFTDNVIIKKSGQLVCLVSKSFRMADSVLFGSEGKRDYRKEWKECIRPEAMVKLPEVPT